MTGSEKTAEGLLARALSLEGDERFSDALAVYAEIVDRFSARGLPAKRGHRVRALHGEACVLSRLGRADDAAAATNAVIAELESEQDPRELTAVAHALLAIARNLNAHEQWGSALDVYEQLIARFEGSEVPELRQQVALALADSTLPLMQLGREPDAIAAQARMLGPYGPDAVVGFEQLAADFPDRVDPDSRALCASALANRAAVLAELGRVEEARAGYAELIARFEHDDLEAVQIVIVHARERQTHLDG